MAQIGAQVAGAGVGILLAMAIPFFNGLVSDPKNEDLLRKSVNEIFTSTDDNSATTTTATFLSTTTTLPSTVTIKGPSMANPITIRRPAVTSTITKTTTAFDTQYITTQAPATQVVHEYFGEVFAKPRDFIPSVTLPSDFYKIGFWILLAAFVCFVACGFWRPKSAERVKPVQRVASAEDADSQHQRFRETAAIVAANEKQQRNKGFPPSAPPQLNLSQIRLTDIVLAIVYRSRDLSHAKIGKATLDRLTADWVSTRDAAKLLLNHNQTPRSIYVRQVQELVAVMERELNKDDETRAKALESVLDETDAGDQAMVNSDSLITFANAINSTRTLAVLACKEIYTVPVVAPLPRKNVPKHKLAELPSEVEQGVPRTLIRQFPKGNKVLRQSFRPRRSSTINSDEFEEDWKVDISSSQPAKKHKASTAETVAQEDSTATTPPNVEDDVRPEHHDEDIQDEVDEIQEPPSSDHKKTRVDSCPEVESELPAALDPGSKSILEDVGDVPSPCKPVQEPIPARSPSQDAGTDVGSQTPSAAEIQPDTAALQVPELGADATPKDTELKKDADEVDRAPPTASKTVATEAELSAPEWYQNLFDRTFPGSWEAIWVTGKEELCGLHALIKSIEAQIPSCIPPSLHELRVTAENLDLDELSNYSIGSLGLILHAWGQKRNLKLHVGVCDKNDKPWAVDSSDPSEQQSIFTQDDPKVVWICSDDKDMTPKERDEYNVLSHYSGVGPKHEFSKDSEASHQESLLDQSLPQGSPTHPESEQPETTAHANTNSASDAGRSTPCPAKQPKKVTFSIPVEDAHSPRDLSPPSELSHDPSTSVNVAATNAFRDHRTGSSSRARPATMHDISKKLPKELSRSVTPPPALNTTDKPFASVPHIPWSNEDNSADLKSAQETFAPVLAEVSAPERTVSNGLAEPQPEAEHRTQEIMNLTSGKTHCAHSPKSTQITKQFLEQYTTNLNKRLVVSKSRHSTRR